MMQPENRVKGLGLVGLRQSVVGAVVLAVLSVAVSPIGAVSWFDDFNDGSAVDASPLTWFPHPALPGDYNATSGDYVFNPGFGTSDDDSMIASVEPAANPGLPAFTDMSIRTRMLAVEPEPSGLVATLGLAARFDASTVSGYVVLLSSEAPPRDGADLQVITLAGGTPTAELGTIRPLLDANDEALNSFFDVMLQVDVFGSNLQVTAWRPGMPQPAPQFEVADATFSGGTGALVFNENSDFSVGTFRFAKAASFRLIDGDMDADGDVDFDDIDDFVLGLNDPAAFEAANGFAPRMLGDTDNDGDQDFDDISLFVTILTSGAGSAQAVPEPSTVGLAALGLLAMAGYMWRRA